MMSIFKGNYSEKEKKKKQYLWSRIQVQKFVQRFMQNPGEIPKGM